MEKTKEKAKDNLNLRQKLFCDWYIKLGGTRFGTQAAIKAGYSEQSAYSMASDLLKIPKVQAYIAKRRTEIEDLLGFNKITLIQDLHQIKARSMQAEPVMVWDRSAREMVQATVENEEGKEIGLYEFDSNGANRASENIAKMMGYNEPEKVEDVTPLDRKAPTTVVVNKTYADKATDQPRA